MLGGQIANANSERIAISYYDNYVAHNNIFVESELDAEGKFLFPLKLDHPQIIFLEYNRQILPIYVRPEDQVFVNFDANDLLLTIQFQGDGNVENRFLINFQKRYELFPDRYIAIYPSMEIPSFVFRMMQEMKPTEFKEMCFQSQAVEQKYYEKITRDTFFNPEFTQFMDGVLKYRWTGYLLAYADHTNSETALPDNYYDFAEMLPLDRPDLLPYDYFQGYLDTYLLYYKLDQEKFDGELAFKEQFETAATYLEGPVLNYQQMRLFMLELRNRPSYSVQKYYDELIQGAAYESHKEILGRSYRSSEKFKSGSPAFQITGKDLNGNEITVKKQKGKYIYLDFWASWCGVCLQDMSKAKSNKEILQGENVEFIYVSIDEDFENAKEAWEKHNTGGTFVWTGRSEKVMESYELESLPVHYILDPEFHFLPKEVHHADPRFLDFMRSLMR